MLSIIKRILNISKQNSGLSLLELSIIISFTSALAVGYLSWTTPAVETRSQKIMETKNKIKIIATAMNKFRINTSRLPCPADPLKKPDNSRASGTDYYVNSFGMEDLDSSDSTINGVKTLGIDCPDNFGSIPVYSLGLSTDYMFDAWGRKFSYHVSKQLCGADEGVPVSSTTAEDNISKKRGCTPHDYFSRTGDIKISNGSQYITKNAAYSIISHGANGKGAYLPNGTKLADGTEDELTNSSNTSSNLNKFIKKPHSSSFDDIVFFRTRDKIEKLTSNKFEVSVSVANCETNSQILKNLTISEGTRLDSNLKAYEQIVENAIMYPGQEVVLKMLWAVQSECVANYGATGEGVSGWSGAQCPGNSDPTSNGSTYNADTNSCSCLYGTRWGGGCRLTTPPDGDT